MNVEYIDVDDIIPYEKNSKTHPKEQIDKIKQSIKEFNFNVPLVLDKDKVIIAGHGRLLAAKQLGMEKVPCILKTDLNEAQIKAFRIADNKVAESDWNIDFLKDELQSLDNFNYNSDWLGFNKEELSNLNEEYNAEEVDKTYSHLITCPNCNHQFKKKED